MADVFLIHWNEAEARERAALLERSGHRVRIGWKQDGSPGRALKRQRPDAVVIDLRRLPSHGRQLALWLREQRFGRDLPIVFVEGDPAKTERLRGVFPESPFTPWTRVRSALKKALAGPRPLVVPPKRPDYSGTPLPKKLGIRADATVALLGAPAGFDRTLGELPAGVRVRRRAQGACDVILLFTKSRADLTKRFPAAQRVLADGGGLWVCWPKKASGVATDLAQPAVQKVGLDAGLVDNKICAVDETWSGQRFMRRRAR